jgi:hypothetical protein
MRLTARSSTSPTSLVFRLAERLPAELGALLVVGPIESDQVQMRVQAEIGPRPLHNRARAGLRSAHALLRRALGVERVHRLREDAREPAEHSAGSVA